MGKKSFAKEYYERHYRRGRILLSLDYRRLPYDQRLAELWDAYCAACQRALGDYPTIFPSQPYIESCALWSAYLSGLDRLLWAEWALSGEIPF